jgi:hypothetical protein
MSRSRSSRASSGQSWHGRAPKDRAVLSQKCHDRSPSRAGGSIPCWGRRPWRGPQEHTDLAARAPLGFRPPRRRRRSAPRCGRLPSMNGFWLRLGGSNSAMANRSHPHLAFVRASMRRRRTCSDQSVFGEQQERRRNPQNDADNGEGIAETHDQGLSLDNIPERHDRLMLRRAWV